MMIPHLVTAATFVAALGSGLLAGLYFAYSNSAIPALNRLPVPQAVAALQHVNTVILNPLFLGLFAGVAVLSLLLVLAAFLGWTPHPRWIIAGSALYLIGHIAVTIAIHVPMNIALEAAAPDSAQAAQLWTTIIDRWQFWNHIRAIACTGAMAAFILALM